MSFSALLLFHGAWLVQGESRTFHDDYYDRDQNDVQDDSGNTSCDRACKVGGCSELALGKACNDYLYKTPDQTAGDHGNDEHYIYHPFFTREDAVKISGYRTIDRKFKGHCDT